MSVEATPAVRRISLHLVRVGLLTLILVLINWRYTTRPVAEVRVDLDPVALRAIFPTAEMLGEATREGRQEVVDADGQTLGYVVQTSPASDDVVGFSGPTNVLLAFGPDDRIVATSILSSGDTRDHVRQVKDDPQFLASFVGKTWSAAAQAGAVDAVSGATLTSLAIQDAIIRRLGGGQPSLRFPEPLQVADVQPIFAAAQAVEPDPSDRSLWHVHDDSGNEVGTVLRTTPAADGVIGYQGPTEARIGFDANGRVAGISLGRSFDNEPYVTYVREDDYFLQVFHDLVLAEVARIDLDEAGVEGVSGATMTSMAVAESVVVAAEQRRQNQEAARQAAAAAAIRWTVRDFGTAATILVGLTIGLTSWRSRKVVRILFQCWLIVYLGFVNGDMLSQAMIVGWAQSGVPWRTAGGLVLLTLAAFLVPLTTKRNIYCTHLCPHGAAQQLVRNRLAWRPHLSPRLSRLLKLLPAALLAWCLVVAVASLPFSLVDIEPFDAYIFRIAGWSTIAIAVVGLVASLFVPMAYCRFGCPTGALLNYVRFNTRSDRWTGRDWLCVTLVLLALGLSVA